MRGNIRQLWAVNYTAERCRVFLHALMITCGRVTRVAGNVELWDDTDAEVQRILDNVLDF